MCRCSGVIRAKIGFRLRDQETWKLEHGKDENKKWLERDAQAIVRENERRLREAGSTVPQDSA